MNPDYPDFPLGPIASAPATATNCPPSPALDQFRADRNAAAVAAPGVFELGGRSFFLVPASIEDAGAWHEAAKAAIQNDMDGPLAAFNKQLNALQAQALVPGGEPVNPLLLKALAPDLISIATAARGAGKAEPTTDQLAAWMFDLAGIRWYTFYRLHKVDPTVDKAWVAEHVTRENWGHVTRQFNAIDRLDKLHPSSARPTG